MRRLIFKSFIDYPKGTIILFLSKSCDAYAAVDPECLEKWRQNWEEYNNEIFMHPESIGECGFISCLDGLAIGLGSWDPRQYPEKGIVGHNCILPALSRRGYGKQQMLEILERLQIKGFRKAVASSIETDFFIPAQRMYESCGFKEIRRSYLDSNSKFRTIEYELVFDKEWDVWKESLHGAKL